MDIALASQLNHHELRGINLCRLFFKALTISDITNASGNRLSPGILKGTPLISQSQPKGPRVKQPSPSPRAWTAWRKMLRLVSGCRGILHIPHRLHEWTTSGNQLHRRWTFLYSPSSDSLYRSFEATFEVSGKVRTRVFSFTSNQTVSVAPPDVVPVDCEERSDGWCILSMPRPQEETIQFDLTWDDYILSLDRWEPMLLQRIYFLHQSPFDIHQQLSEAPSATLVSDGGADHFQGSAGWVIAVGNHRIIQGQCPIPGFDPRSY
jgi:hypothetical protein